MSTMGRGHASGGEWRRLLRRPTSITESTRWLFAALALVSLVLSLPATLSTSDGAMAAIVLVATLALGASCIHVYLTRRVPAGLDVVDAVMIAAVALAAPTPTTVVAYVFTAVWFRALYGSTVRSLMRCVLSSAALLGAVALWPLMPGHAGAASTNGLFESLPLLFLAVFIARQLGGGLQAREQSTRRDTALAGMGSRLLGVTDVASIRTIAWAAAAEICAATPTLRLLRAVQDGSVLRVAGATGGFQTVPATLPATLITASPAPDEDRIRDSGPLNAAAGAVLEWACLNLTDPNERAWLLVGASRAIPVDAMLSVRGLSNQVALALRNSDVHQQLSVQAQFDSLTGLENRASFTAKLSAGLTRNAGHGAMHVLFLDLDDFKDVNDILGHRAGDAVLVEVAARLKRCTRPEDTCARLGGDEFAVVLYGGTDHEAAEVAQRAVDSIAQPIHAGGRLARVGASVGIGTAGSGVDNDNDIDIDELVHQADVAMYAAKANGKGQVQAYHPGLLQVDAPRLSFEWQLSAAAAAGELVVHYQPIVSLPEIHGIGVEALVRWQHPERGLLLPAHFVSIAERTGAIVDIGAFVMRQACREASAWQLAHPGDPLTVHVNVSARELDHDHFIETVLSCLAETGMRAESLVLELTETVILDAPAAILRLRTLAGHGIKIAIDDFGTGYASLTTLRSLPVDIVKLDMSFVAGALTNPVDRTVITAIVQMSAELGIQTVAEGVELLEQQRFLEEIGADAAQGYFYARPIPAPEMTTWLRRNLDGGAEGGGSVIPLRARRPA